MTDWHKLRDVALFLSCFRTPHTFVEVVEIVPWREFARWEPGQLLDRLMAEGLLEPAEPGEPLDQRLLRLTVLELQSLSKGHRLPVSRPKGELIAQLIGRDREAMERAALHRTLIRCTEEGTAVAERYLAEGAHAVPQQAAVPGDPARKVIERILLAAAGGIIGDAAYDGLKAVVSGLAEKAQAEDAVRLPFEPETVPVPAGSFLMGTSDRQIEYMIRHFDWAREWQASGWFQAEQPQHRVTLPAYQIGRYPVTNAQFGRFLDDGGYRSRDYWTRAGWAAMGRGAWWQPCYWDDEQWNAPAQPVVGVSWYEALAYCRWLAAVTGRPYRLPTEAEWEKAARGEDARIWPWGNEWDPKRCNWSGSGNTRVGQYSPGGDSPYECADMAGNVWEWCGTKRRSNYQERADESLEGDATRVLRGGASGCSEGDLRCAARDWLNPRSRGYIVGFRCVIAPG